MYTLSGGAKALTLVLDAARGQAHYLSPDALSYFAAMAVARQSAPPALAEGLVGQEGWYTSALLAGALVLELSGLAVAFLPRIQVAWTVAIVGMHLGILLVVGPNFSLHAVAVWLLFVAWRTGGARASAGPS